MKHLRNRLDYNYKPTIHKSKNCPVSASQISHDDIHIKATKPGPVDLWPPVITWPELSFTTAASWWCPARPGSSSGNPPERPQPRRSCDSNSRLRKTGNTIHLEYTHRKVKGIYLSWIRAFKGFEPLFVRQISERLRWPSHSSEEIKIKTISAAVSVQVLSHDALIPRDLNPAILFYFPSFTKNPVYVDLSCIFKSQYQQTHFEI